jgi:phospholipase/carboxylesterase
MNATRTEIGGLTTHVVGPADAPTTVVLLHGFGASGDDLVPLAQAFAPRGAERSGGAMRFVFPEAPLALGRGYGDGRAWWHLDLARLEEELARGIVRDRRAEMPEGLTEARDQVGRLLDELAASDASGGRVVLGGFSQGAMLALDVALHRPAPPAALVLLSGTLLAEAAWAPRWPTLAGVPVVLSHGRADGLLPFAVAEALRDQLRAAGAEVDWHPFRGGHEIPMEVLEAVARLLRRVAAGSTATAP